MSFVSIRLPEEFISETKQSASKDYRTIPQQIMYWAELGKKQELRNWQLKKMHLGLQQHKIIISRKNKIFLESSINAKLPSRMVYRGIQ